MAPIAAARGSWIRYTSRAPAWIARVRHRPALHAGHPAGDGDHHLRLPHPEPPADLGDEVAQHGLGDHVVRDHPAAHGADDLDAARGPPQHLAGLVAHGLDPVVVGGDGDHRGLVDHDPLALHEDEDVRRAQVDTDLQSGGMLLHAGGHPVPALASPGPSGRGGAGPGRPTGESSRRARRRPVRSS